jgi:hypothetical protein
MTDTGQSACFESDVEQLVAQARAWCDAWLELSMVPLACCYGWGSRGAACFHSDDFPVRTCAHPRSLVISKPLKVGISLSGAEQIPNSAVHFRPASLAAGAPSFRFTVEARDLQGLPGGTYWGEVTARVDPPGVLAQPGDEVVQVWIVIP